MGFKKRDVKGTLRTAVLKALKDGDSLTRRELLAELRDKPKLSVSQRRLSQALGRLLDEGRIVQEGQRATARFRRAGDSPL